MADRLAERNRQLRKWHGLLADRVVALARTDLVRGKDKVKTHNLNFELFEFNSINVVHGMNLVNSIKVLTLFVLCVGANHHRPQWAAGIKEMREVFGRLEAEGYTRESQQVRGCCCWPRATWRRPGCCYYCYCNGAASLLAMRYLLGNCIHHDHCKPCIICLLHQVWRQHWDFQLYKALEVQYRAGLEGINKLLPDMEVKLVFRQGRLQVWLLTCTDKMH